jgi:hypothetical protein
MSAVRLRSRAATAIIRKPAFWVAAAGHVAVLAAFLLVWGDGMPSLSGTVLHQMMTVQAITLAVLLPWAAVRCRSLSRPAIVRLAKLKAQPPSRLVMARAGGIAAALTGLALAGLPMLLLALQVSAAPFSAMMIPAAPVVAMIPFVAVLATWCELLIACRITGWVVTAGLTVAVAVAPEPAGTMIFGIGAAIGLAALGSLGNRVLRQPAPVMRTHLV